MAEGGGQDDKSKGALSPLGGKTPIKTPDGAITPKSKLPSDKNAKDTKLRESLN